MILGLEELPQPLLVQVDEDYLIRYVLGKPASHSALLRMGSAIIFMFIIFTCLLSPQYLARRETFVCCLLV